MITNIDIDEAIVLQAMQLSGARTKREVVDRALRELVARATRPSVRELFGIGGVEPDYDPKSPGARGGDAGVGRVEHSVHEPSASYRPAVKKAAAAQRPKKT